MQYGGLNTPMDITACAASFALRPLDLPRLPLCVLPSQGYAKIMQVLGSNVAAFLTNLNNLHLHMSMGWPSMKPPSFRVEEVCILRGGGGRQRRCKVGRQERQRGVVGTGVEGQAHLGAMHARHKRHARGTPI
jgi:hypothetical protein